MAVVVYFRSTIMAFCTTPVLTKTTTILGVQSRQSLTGTESGESV